MGGSGVNRTDRTIGFVSGNLRFGQDRSFLRVLSVVVVTCQGPRPHPNASRAPTDAASWISLTGCSWSSRV
jgi:hypothetical protein